MCQFAFRNSHRVCRLASSILIDNVIVIDNTISRVLSSDSSDFSCFGTKSPPWCVCITYPQEEEPIPHGNLTFASSPLLLLHFSTPLLLHYYSLGLVTLAHDVISRLRPYLSQADRSKSLPLILPYPTQCTRQTPPACPSHWIFPIIFHAVLVCARLRRLNGSTSISRYLASRNSLEVCLVQLYFNAEVMLFQFSNSDQSTRTTQRQVFSL